MPDLIKKLHLLINDCKYCGLEKLSLKFCMASQPHFKHTDIYYFITKFSCFISDTWWTHDGYRCDLWLYSCFIQYNYSYLTHGLPNPKRSAWQHQLLCAYLCKKCSNCFQTTKRADKANLQIAI